MVKCSSVGGDNTSCRNLTLRTGREDSTDCVSSTSHWPPGGRGDNRNESKIKYQSDRCNKVIKTLYFCSWTVVLVYSVCSYLVVLVHAEATHFGLDVFADMFGGRQEATLRLKTQHMQNSS